MDVKKVEVDYASIVMLKLRTILIISSNHKEQKFDIFSVCKLRIKQKFIISIWKFSFP